MTRAWRFAGSTRAWASGARRWTPTGRPWRSPRLRRRRRVRRRRRIGPSRSTTRRSRPPTSMAMGRPRSRPLCRRDARLQVHAPSRHEEHQRGTWSLVTGTSPYIPTPPFSDKDGWNDPSLYLTIRTGHFDQSNPSATVLIGRSHSGLEGYEWVPSYGWSLTACPCSPRARRRSSPTAGAGRRRAMRRSGSRRIRGREQLRPGRRAHR